MPGTLTRLFMTTDTVGGVWTYALDVARGLAPLGVRTTLATLGPEASAGQRAEAAGVAGLVLIDTGAALDWLAADEAAVAHGAAHMARLARMHGAEMVHLNTPALAALTAFGVPVVGACHSCLASWWSAVRGGAPPADFGWRTALLVRGYGSCDAVIAPSAAFAETTAALYGVRPVVVHNGTTAAGMSAGARDRHVLTAGRLWDEGKNLATLDCAAALIDAPVLAAGALQGPAGDAAQVRHVVALGRLDGAALRLHMARAPVFASLALYEPFGLSVLEAARAGCALVLSDTGSFRELWDGAAIFVPARDDRAAAAALQGLLDDADRTAALGRAAAARAASYTVGATAAGTLAVYRRVLAHAASEHGRRLEVAG